MEIKVEVSPETWQKFSILCTGKDATEVLTKMVNDVWEKAPAIVKRLRGETVKEEPTAEKTPTA